MGNKNQGMTQNAKNKTSFSCEQSVTRKSLPSHSLPNKSSGRGITHEWQEGVAFHEAGGPLSSFYGSCAKHRADPTHHDRFIAVDEFKKESFSLPAEAEHLRLNIFEYIRLCLMLTVRLHVDQVSPHRPLKMEDGSKYLFGDKRGQKKPLCGSGFIHYVEKKEKESIIQVATACHVNFDTTESQSSRLVLFDFTNDGSGKVTVSGGRCGGSHTERDYSYHHYPTHDQALAARLGELLRQRNEARDRLLPKLRALPAHVIARLPVFLPSHPHSRKLYVSVGAHRGREGEIWHTRARAVYHTAASCPGSSGGRVIDLAEADGHDWLARPHSGVTKDGTARSCDFGFVLRK